MDTDLPRMVPPESTPPPEESLGAIGADVTLHESPPGDFPFFPPSTSTASNESIGLGVVLDAPSLTGRCPEAPADGRSDRPAAEMPDLHPEEHPHAWLTRVLFSYASAVTLALAWTLWTGRSFRSPEVRSVEPAAAASATDVAPSPAPSEPSALAEPLPTLPSRNLTSLGGSIRLGEIEITPLGVDRGFVELRRSIDPGETRLARQPSYLLKVRFKNVSSDRTFMPLEVFAVRESPGIPNETILESERGRIAMYPLALESEWSIPGQQFPRLGPGESAETLIATAPVAANKLGDSNTWRIRLRVSPHQTDVCGVRFSHSEINDPTE